MKNTKHTPGPWKFRTVYHDNGTTPLAVLLETQAPNQPHNDPCVLAVREDWTGYLTKTEHGQANARLIAAAPELLEALKSMLSKEPQSTGYESGEKTLTCMA